MFEEMQARVTELFKTAPVKDLENTVKAAMQQGFQKLELASKEDLDLQAELLARARSEITALELRIAALERAEPGTPKK